MAGWKMRQRSKGHISRRNQYYVIGSITNPSSNVSESQFKKEKDLSKGAAEAVKEKPAQATLQDVAHLNSWTMNG